jgi:hypothetical protein
MQTYGFAYTDCNGKVYKKEITTPGATWMECMNDYVRFLESVFQYDIMNNVRLREPVYLSSLRENYSDYLDPWTGKYFVDEEVEDELTDEYGWGDPE